MKKWFRMLLCAAALTAAMTVSAFAAEPGLLIAPNPNAMPERQGDFYVMVNGEYVTFTDAVPQLRDSRSFLPFVAVFEQLGFPETDMTWDGSTGTVTATKGDVTLTLVIGKREIQVTRAGETTTIPTDVAPYVDAESWRTYIPFGLVADALGYNVGWDAACGAVLIDDVDAILANNTETYALMDKYLNFGREFRSRNYKVTGDYFYEIWGTEPMEDASLMTTALFYSGGYEMLLSKGAAAYQMTSDMLVDMAWYADGEDITPIMQALMELGGVTMPLTVELEMLGDIQNGIVYSRPVEDHIMGGDPVPEGTWSKEPLEASTFSSFGSYPDTILADQLGVDFADISYAEVVKALLQTLPLTDRSYTGVDYLADLNALYADSSFVRSGSTYDSYVEGEDGYAALCLFTSGSEVTGYGLSTFYYDPDAGWTEVVITLKDRKLEMYTALTYEPQLLAPEGTAMELYMEMTADYTPTALTPDTAPPAGAVILDLTAEEAPVE